MGDKKRYGGGCHCGKVRFEVEADISEVMTCNCSICSKRGWMLSFVGESDFKLLSGKDHLTDYQFGKKHIHHVFCKNCGQQSFGHGAGQDGQVMYAVNVRCLDGVETEGLKVNRNDGRSA